MPAIEHNLDPNWLAQHSERSLHRLLPRLESRFGTQTRTPEWRSFRRRLDTHFERLFALLYRLYGQRYDFFFHLENIIGTAAEYWLARPADLKQLDSQRETQPGWFQDHRMVAGVCYVDLFANNLAGLRDKLPYLQELNLSYLHLMPLFKSPAGDNDGGYAVSSYRDVDPALGTMEVLRALATDLRAAGISLAVDFIFNHTSSEHVWARKAIAGEPDFIDFYHFFPDRQMPDAYEQHLREIFPEEHPGAFTWHEPSEQWVWTTFHSYQWDLNYANPAVFDHMAAEMLFLANVGVEVLRLDAVAFIWKQMGTSCENLPEAHLLIQAFNALVQISAPAMVFKSEAIVHPNDVAAYIHPEECQISYNPTLMALLWESLATRKVALLQTSMAGRFAIHPGTAWVNYVRVHDDIGWTFSDEDAWQVGINGYDHRQFLNSFYTGRFPGSFARGLPFQENVKTGDMRISGTLASLAGLEKALRIETGHEVDLAIQRILLMYSVVMSIGGIPLIYLGDEIATLNDYGFSQHPDHGHDSRWVHRVPFDWAAAEARHDEATVAGKLFTGVQRLIRARLACPSLSGGVTEVFATGSEHVFGFVRTHPDSDRRVVVLANFSEAPQQIDSNVVRMHGLAYSYAELLTGDTVRLNGAVFLDSYQSCWLAG